VTFIRIVKICISTIATPLYYYEKFVPLHRQREKTEFAACAGRKIVQTSEVFFLGRAKKEAKSETREKFQQNNLKVIREAALRSDVSQGVMKAYWDAADEVIKA